MLAAAVAPAAAQAIVPSTSRVVNALGTELNSGARYPDISRDGRWMTFQSTATNAVSGSAGSQVYLSDRVTGELRLVSKSAGGVPGNGSSTQPAISGDGRFVVFQTGATNLATGATNTADDIMLYDSSTGILRRLSTSLTGGDANDWARDARISADGSTVVFTSGATNLVAGDAGFLDVFAIPTAGGPLERVSTRLDGATANGSSLNAGVSSGGRVVVFATDSSDIVTPDANGKRDIIAVDRTTGARTRVSVNSGGGEANGDANFPAITADGCLVAFNDTATNLVAGDDLTGATKTFVRDRCTGSTEFASLRGNGTQGPVASNPVAISDDGCIVAMVSPALTSAPPVLGGALALRNRCNGTTTRADVSTAGDAGNNGVSTWPRLSAGSGRYVAFDSAADNLVPGDGNGVSDVFLHDRANALPPVADVQVVTSGLNASADALASNDPDGRIVSAQIGWGDGSADVAGLQATHTYAQAGAYTVTVVVTDSDGLVAIARKAITITAPPPGDPITPTPPNPGDIGLPPLLPKTAELALSRVALSRSSFTPAPVRGKATGKQGAKLTLTSSEAASLDLRFERVVAGRKTGGTCKPGGQRGARCTILRAAGKVTARLRAGFNTIALTGRIGGRALAAGPYRLTLTMRTADGRASQALRRTLTIIKGRS